MIALRAEPKTAARWSEIWRAEVSPIWHATFSGIPPVRRDPATSSRIPEWRPWPGEEVHIAVDKPGGAPGRTLTIDASTLDIEPGLHGSQMTLALELRSSRGTDHRIALPAAAEVTAIQRDNATQPIRQERGDLILSIPPGKHAVTINWRQPVAVSTLFRAPAVDLRLPSTNSTVNIKLFEKPRWVLWLAGPFMGPAVGLWAVVAILLLGSIVLARTRLTPLRSHHFLLLGLGLTQTDLVPALLVVAFLLALGWRARRVPTENRPMLYNAGQLALATLIVASVIVIATAIDAGLLRIPDTFIAGNNPMPYQLSWFEDRADPVLAQPSLLSVLLWVYRVAVMAWALWLAVAASRWSSWAWGCLKQHGLWRPVSRPVTIPPSGG